MPVFDYDINAPIASRILGRQAFVGFGGRFYEFTFEMLAGGRRDELVSRMKVDRVDLYKKLGLDIIPVRLVPGKVYNLPRRLGEHEWIFYPIEGTDEIWFKWRFNVEYDTMSQYDSSINQRGMEGLEEYVEALESEEPSVSAEELELVEYVVKSVGEEMLVMGDVGTVFPIQGWLTTFSRALYTRPDLVRRFFHETARRGTEYINAMIDAGVEAISDGCDVAYKNGPFMSPKHFREFVLPALKDHVRVSHKRGVPFIKHTDGNIKPIEGDLLVESGVDGYMAIEPAAGMDIGELKRKYGDRICLLGNVDCAYTLVHGREEDVRVETMEIIRAAASGGGLVVASSNSIHSFVKLENFLAMIATTREYGKYPLRLR